MPRRFVFEYNPIVWKILISVTISSTKLGAAGMMPSVPSMPNFEIEISDEPIFKGQLHLLPIIHDTVPYLMKHQPPVQHYHIYIAMATGHHYISAGFGSGTLPDSHNHFTAKAEIHLEAMDYLATDFEIYDVDNPNVPNTLKYYGGYGHIYVAIKGTTKVYWAIVR